MLLFLIGSALILVGIAGLLRLAAQASSSDVLTGTRTQALRMAIGVVVVGVVVAMLPALMR